MEADPAVAVCRFLPVIAYFLRLEPGARKRWGSETEHSLKAAF